MKKINIFKGLSFALIGGGALASVPIALTSCKGNIKNVNMFWSTYDNMFNDFSSEKFINKYSHGHEYKDYSQKTRAEAGAELKSQIKAGDILMIAMGTVVDYSEYGSGAVIRNISIIIAEQADYHFDMSIEFTATGNDKNTVDQYFYTTPGSPCSLALAWDDTPGHSASGLWKTWFQWHVEDGAGTIKRTSNYAGGGMDDKNAWTVVPWAIARHLFNVSLPN